jgi:hypothetical protein
MKLVEAYNKYKCDKGSLKHRYDRVYEPVLDNLRQQREFDLLEIGILRGNSIEAILEFAPQTKVVGVDTFQRIKPTDVPILKHPNVSWLRSDSTESVSGYGVVAGRRFDIIIDDGAHTHDAQRKTFENFIPYLKEDGVYFIEDVWPFDMMTKEEKQHPWLKKHPNDWTDKKYQQLLETLKPYNVLFHDLRKGFEPDSFIIEVRK